MTTKSRNNCTVRILTDQEKCEKLIENKNLSDKKILAGFNFKKILNHHFQPDSYVFICKGEDVLPLVVKNNVAYFYGGNLPYNDYNIVPNDREIINEAIKYLKINRINFCLTSITKDPTSNLTDQNLNYDVPYNQNWVYKNLSKYNQDDLLKSIKIKKKRDKVKRAIKKSTDYKFKQIGKEDFKSEYMEIFLKLSIDSFERRGRDNSWKEYSLLYKDISNYFVDNFICVNKALFREDEIVGSYCLVINDSECFLAFCNNFVLNDENIPYILYLDALDESKKECKTLDRIFNAGRGSFSYKRRLGFTPEPMYALVNTPKWQKKYNHDLSIEETLKLYGRDFYSMRLENEK